MVGREWRVSLEELAQDSLDIARSEEEFDLTDATARMAVGNVALCERLEAILEVLEGQNRPLRVKMVPEEVKGGHWTASCTLCGYLLPAHAHGCEGWITSNRSPQ